MSQPSGITLQAQHEYSTMSPQSFQHICDQKFHIPPAESSPLLREKSCPCCMDLDGIESSAEQTSSTSKEKSYRFYIYFETMCLWPLVFLWQLLTARESGDCLDRFGPAALTALVGLCDIITISHALSRRAPFLLLSWYIGVASGFILFVWVDAGIESVVRYAAAVGWVVLFTTVITMSGLTVSRETGADLESGNAVSESKREIVQEGSSKSFEPDMLVVRVPGDMQEAIDEAAEGRFAPKQQYSREDDGESWRLAIE